MAGRKGTSRATARGRHYAGGLRSSVTGRAISAWAFKGKKGKVIGDHHTLTSMSGKTYFDTPTGRANKARKARKGSTGRKGSI